MTTLPLRRPTLALVVLSIAAIVAACSGSPGSSPASSSNAGGAGDCPTSQPAALAAGETRTVTLDTAKGRIVIGIQADLAPIAAGNFVALASCGYYDETVFHRVVPTFVIQGGDPSGTGGGGPGYEIEDEPVTTPYHRGTVAMARTRAPNSVGSQFFIVLTDEAGQGLAQTNTYQIIGDVTSGMDAADAIAAAADKENPTDPVEIITATVTSP